MPVLAAPDVLSFIAARHVAACRIVIISHAVPPGPLEGSSPVLFAIGQLALVDPVVGLNRAYRT